MFVVTNSGHLLVTVGKLGTACVVRNGLSEKVG